MGCINMLGKTVVIGFAIVRGVMATVFYREKGLCVYVMMSDMIVARLVESGSALCVIG
jgi:hypothetical protein